MTDIVTPPAIDAMPPAPQPTDTPEQFDAKSYANLQAQTVMVAQVNASNAATKQNATAAVEGVNAATTAAAAATAAAASASATAGAAKWAAGNYTEGAAAWSPLDQQTYRRKTTGASATDPSLDAIGWTRLGGGALPFVDMALLAQIKAAALSL